MSRLSSVSALVPCSNVIIFTTTAPVCVWKPIHLHVMFWSQSRYTPKKGLRWQTKRERKKKIPVLKDNTSPPQTIIIIQVTHTSIIPYRHCHNSAKTQNSKPSVIPTMFHPSHPYHLLPQRTDVNLVLKVTSWGSSKCLHTITHLPLDPVISTLYFCPGRKGKQESARHLAG